MNLAVFILSQIVMTASFFALGLAVWNAIYTFGLTGRRKRHVRESNHKEDTTK